MAARRFPQPVQWVEAHRSHCLAAGPRYALCAKGHLTTDHQCPVEGRRLGEGNPCPHRAARFTNCGGAHRAWADACTVKREARLSTRGWKSLPPPRRGRGAAAPEVPDHKALVVQEEVETGEVEAEGRIEPSPEEMEE